ncbi:diguanylate cyclase (GGDEF)-like protein [Pullulanibacillus pueri]|uniref:GGDEF domain-containing protein n=1 Tax=Pullulanibacillus pueri TaxID=1437324 RepID=A0A8J2ZYD8_9BACL|nr:sensor domain-containing diguanylate cyclase [Pullulanibacillus pueri]MBM7683297.1 diguanylate cyclase (GGDEF)-like protein [Pullulanibacillus pueri]GGH85862.1 hypothetical protein GCM10007096_32240 [Pullulanibacillus pueri]
MTKNKKIGVWVIWAFLWPAAILLIYKDRPPMIGGAYLSVIGMVILMIVSTFFYFKLRDRDIVVVEGISIATFLIFGLFIEMVIAQLMIIIYAARKRYDKESLYKLPLNALMFLFVSIVSGYIYYFLGGTTGVIKDSGSINILPVLVYGVSFFLSNQVFIFLVTKWVYRQAIVIDKELLWEALTLVLVIPIGLVLYLLYSDMGGKALFFIALPIVTLSVIFHLVNKSYSINRLLQKTSDVGRELTGILDVDDILSLFFKKIQTMLEIDYAYLVMRDDADKRHLTYKYEKKIGLLEHAKMTNRDVLEGWDTKESIRIGTQKELKRKGLASISKLVQSAMVIPYGENDRTLGSVIVASKQKRVYEKHHMIMLKILVNFLFVAINNAKDYEKTKNKSERDPLTNLYNYRFFSEQLDRMFVDTTNRYFSIMMIDLDHFKRINDTYGHESGNSVLCDVSHRLLSIVNDKGLVARYGGEEFIILLPKMDTGAAYTMAEDIRIRLSHEPFLIQTDIGYEGRRFIHITASIGVATAPIQGEDPMSLIRNADRAMYSGAKQQGRNRVATYTG